MLNQSKSHSSLMLRSTKKLRPVKKDVPQLLMRQATLVEAPDSAFDSEDRMKRSNLEKVMAKVRLQESNDSHSKFYYRLSNLNEQIQVYQDIIKSHDRSSEKSPPRENKLVHKPKIITDYMYKLQRKKHESFNY